MLEDRLRRLGGRIQELRQARGLTQAQLAEAADLSTNYVGEVERGESQATLDALFRLADALGVNPSRLFDALDRPETAEETIRRMRELLDVLEFRQGR